MTPIIAALVVATVATVATIGQPAPSFTLKNVKDQPVSLADYKNQVVVLEWLNFDCPFVKKHYASGNMPQLQQSYTAKGVVWLSVNSIPSLKADTLAQRAAKEGSKATHILMDSDTSLARAFAAKVTPHLFIIGKDGSLAYDGAIDSKSSADPADIPSADKLFANALDAVLAGKDVPKPKNPPYGCAVKISQPSLK